MKMGAGKDGNARGVQHVVDGRFLLVRVGGGGGSVGVGVGVLLVLLLRVLLQHTGYIPINLIYI